MKQYEPPRNVAPSIIIDTEYSEKLVREQLAYKSSFFCGEGLVREFVVGRVSLL